MSDKKNIIWSKIKDYVSIARPDHWSKHVFIIPGVIFAFVLVEEHTVEFPISLFFGFPAACLLSSANYVINEWSDAEFDKFHPIKKHRPAASGRLSGKIVLLEYILLTSTGLYLSSLVSHPFFITAIIFLMMALLYNLKPFRLKDRVFLDVLSESINNPLRLMFGWFMVASHVVPPSSLVISYWFGGAFLMAAKRLAEFRFITRRRKLDNLKVYRKSFRSYTENSLLVSSFLYGLLSSFFISAFLIKHRHEFLFVFPVIASLFAYYLSISLRKVSLAQTPEKLYKDKRLVILVILLVVLMIAFSFIDIPFAEKLIGIQKGLNYSIWE